MTLPARSGSRERMASTIATCSSKLSLLEISGLVGRGLWPISQSTNASWTATKMGFETIWVSVR